MKKKIILTLSAIEKNGEPEMSNYVFVAERLGFAFMNVRDRLANWLGGGKGKKHECVLIVSNDAGTVVYLSEHKSELGLAPDANLSFEYQADPV